MRVKLDENLGTRGTRLLREAGCDVATVMEQGLNASSDETIIEVARAEDRVLVSLDKDFASILRFPPERYAGIVVLRLPEPLELPDLEGALKRLLIAADGANLSGKLWIVDAHRVRVFDDADPA